MPRYVALLRGVSPLNAKMPALKACFEQLDFTDVKTLLSSGNVVFSTASRKSVAALVKTIEAGMAAQLPRSFPVLLRTQAQLAALVLSDPFARANLPANAKRVVTFLAQPPQAGIVLPNELDGARILAVQGSEVLTAYVPSSRGPVFMTLIEKTFGKNVTTRTWDTVKKCAVA